ncbi:MAG: SCO family protein [Gammaproteobacteria bacterium]|nr:SCO family protein [Gammaproteobacteria bacterium]
MNHTVVRVRFSEMLVGIGMAVVIFGIVWIAREFQKPPEAPVLTQHKIQATLLQEPIAVAEFSLTNQFGNSFTKDNLKGHWSYLFFGYTNCPDICPTTMNVLVEMERQLQQDTDLEKPGFVFVSVDPDRDTPEQLAQYMTYFHRDFLGVSGPDDQLKILTKPLGIFYQKNQPEGNEDSYAMQHSSAILLLNPDGAVQALTSPPYDATIMANDYRNIVDF